MKRSIRIIGVASGLGAQDEGCEDGPVAFHHSQVWHELARHPDVDWGRTLFPSDNQSHTPATRIAELCRHLADEVDQALNAGEFPVVLGGDHSIAAGTWSGVARHAGAPIGLLWIDAHLDSHTLETSYSGAIHGMPLAFLLGRGDKRLLELGLPGGQLVPAHSVVFGARSFEPEEVEFLAGMRVRVIGRGEIEQRGFQAAFEEALAIVAGAPMGFGVSFDLDALDPATAPGVGSPEPYGLAANDVLNGLHRLVRTPGLRCLEIVEYNPDRDRQGRTARLIGDLIGVLVERFVHR
ncbi:MAG: arginase [Hydrogenophilales bacterium 28-61-23]|nr:MAG: arginase [Hydrogenophilales bacterium 28-61-23]